VRALPALALLAIGAVGCGGGAPAPQSPGASAGSPTTSAEPAPLEPGPACDAVAAHVVPIIVQDKAARGNYWSDDQVATMTSILQTRCTEDRWSGAARTCMEQVEARRDARACFERLTPAQQDAMKRDEQTRMPKRPDGPAGS
jgi:hypothetical protein